MKPLAEKTIDWKLKPKIAKPIKTKQQSFFDAPMGAVVCICGGKVVQHGRCQKCLEVFLKDVRKELDEMVWDKAKAETNFIKRIAGII
jgi:hypothetical protein